MSCRVEVCPRAVGADAQTQESSDRFSVQTFACSRKVNCDPSAAECGDLQTFVYLISGLGTGEGISWRDAMRAAGSLFTSPGISILLEVITAVSPLVCLRAAPLRVFSADF